MNGFIGKIGRLAVSKAAGFGYAVAVGVAGNLAFNYLQPHQPPAATAPAIPAASAPAVPPSPAPPTAPAVAAAPPVAAPPPVAAAPAPLPRRAHPAPAAAPAVASAPVLPEPPADIALPNSDALPIPVLKPAALPLEKRPLEKGWVEKGWVEKGWVEKGWVEKGWVETRPSETSPPAAANLAATAASEPAAAAPPASGALPPLGPAIDVGPPPLPPAAALEAAPSPPQLASVRPAASPPSRADEAQRDFAISDVWHPGRVVRKGLHWAGRQVPFGDAEPAPHAAPSEPRSGPIPLLPSARDAAAPGHAEDAPPHKPAAPGPGSGGLY